MVGPASAQRRFLAPKEKNPKIIILGANRDYTLPSCLPLLQRERNKLYLPGINKSSLGSEEEVSQFLTLWNVNG